MNNFSYTAFFKPFCKRRGGSFRSFQVIGKEWYLFKKMPSKVLNFSLFNLPCENDLEEEKTQHLLDIQVIARATPASTTYLAYHVH